jgi:hypothetical protein
LTITRAQRDAIYEMVLTHLAGIGDVWICVDRREFATAKRLGRAFAEDLRLLEDLGWAETTDRETVALTVPRDELTHTLARLHEDAAGSLGTYVSRPKDDARERVTYDAVSDEVEVGHGQSRVTFDAESLAFMAIMSGVLPEHVLHGDGRIQPASRADRAPNRGRPASRRPARRQVRGLLAGISQRKPDDRRSDRCRLHRRRGASQRLGGPDSICRSPTCVAGVRMPRRTACSRDAAPVYRPPLARRRHHTRDSYASAWFEPTYRLTTKAIVVEAAHPAKPAGQDAAA